MGKVAVKVAGVWEDVAVGVPEGGDEGQVLGKATDADHDLDWIDGGGGGGIGTLQVPQPKTWVEKWSGSQASVSNSWGQGFYTVILRNGLVAKPLYQIAGAKGSIQ